MKVYQDADLLALAKHNTPKNLENMIPPNMPVANALQMAAKNSFIDAGKGVNAAAIIDQSVKGRNFLMTVKNTRNAACEVALTPGRLFKNTDFGVVQEGAFRAIGDTSSASADLIGTGSPGSIDALLDFITDNPTLVTGFKISSTDPSQLNKIMVFERPTPWRVGNDTDQIFLNNYRNENTFQLNVLTIPEQFTMSKKTAIKLLIPANSTLEITWQFGVSFSIEDGFEGMIESTRNAVQLAGGHKVVGDAIKSQIAAAQLG